MRYLRPYILQVIEKERKMAFISGPRQVGKTTLGKSILVQAQAYFNWDIEKHRMLILKNPGRFWEDLNPTPSRILLDEIHKYPRWKRMLKGIYDDVGKETEIIVTGSGRLDIYQKGGDSLFGRYEPCHLHPFSTGELVRKEQHEILSPDESIGKIIQNESSPAAQEAFNQISEFTGFPEPLFAATRQRLVKWRRLHRELILREDLRDLSRIRDIGLIDALVSLLPERIGAPLSLNSLREDLSVAFGSVGLWLQTLSRLFYLFEIRPYAGKLARTLRKEAKVYLFDFSVIDNDGARFENIVALHLKKACDAWSDAGYDEFDLHYVRDKEKRETDFLVTRDKKPYLLAECKLSGDNLDSNLSYFAERLKPQHCFQIIRDFPKDIRFIKNQNIYLCSAPRFLSQLP